MFQLKSFIKKGEALNIHNILTTQAQARGNDYFQNLLTNRL
jgi:hypothetical protein